jgi:3-phenylpropionate/trans-cinnamate dioxygenase ferredoxin component
LARYRVAGAGEVPAGSLKGVVAGRTEVCLAHAEDGHFYAIADVCTHENFLLSAGELSEFDVECPQHGSRFNVKTGKVTGLPAVVPTRTFAVTVDDGDVYVDV